MLDEACTCANLRNKSISENEINEKKIATLKKELEALEERIANPEYHTARQRPVDFKERSRLPNSLQKVQLRMKRTCSLNEQ